MIKDICCLIGPSPNKLSFGYDETHPECIRLKIKLAVEIEKLRKKGVTTFLSGMTQGVELWGAEILRDLKRAYPDQEIRLVAVIPYAGQADRWRGKNRERYRGILASADQIVTLRPWYAPGCLFERSRYMVDASTHLIAVFGGEPGSVKYTLDYARKKGRKIVIILPYGEKKQGL